MVVQNKLSDAEQWSSSWNSTVAEIVMFIEFGRQFSTVLRSVYHQYVEQFFIFKIKFILIELVKNSHRATFLN